MARTVRTNSKGNKGKKKEKKRCGANIRGSNGKIVGASRHYCVGGHVAGPDHSLPLHDPTDLLIWRVPPLIQHSCQPLQTLWGINNLIGNQLSKARSLW